MEQFIFEVPEDNDPFRGEFVDRIYRSTRIGVEGYDTSLDRHHVMKALSQHFSQCGEVVHVRVLHHSTFNYRSFRAPLLSTGLVYILGQGAGDKALSLTGTDVAGGTIVVRIVSPPLKTKDTVRKPNVLVTGFEPCVPEKRVKKELRKHFGTCGKVTRVSLCEDSNGDFNEAFVFLSGKDSVDKAVKLSGTKMRGREIAVKSDYVLPLPTNIIPSVWDGIPESSYIGGRNCCGGGNC
ncbi:unnamed protein product [Cochlearia groenlandica]